MDGKLFLPFCLSLNRYPRCPLTLHSSISLRPYISHAHPFAFSLSRLLRCLPPSPYPPHRVRPPSSPLPPKTHPFMSWSLCVTTPGLVRKLPAPFVLWMKMCSRMSHPFAPTRRSTRRWNLFWQRCSPVYGHADSLSRSCRDSLATGCCWCHLRGKIFCQMIRYSAVDMELFATT